MLGSLPRLRPLILAEEVAFPQLITKFPQPITKLMVRLEQHKFYSATKEWRSESLVHKSTSQPNLGQGKSKEIESREGGIFMTYLRTRVWFGPETEETLIFSPCVGCCHDHCQLSQPGLVCQLIY